MAQLSKKIDLYMTTGLLLLFAVALGPGVWGANALEFDQIIPYRLLFQQLCHQLPDRSFVLNGWLMPVCSRCIGIYGGLATTWLVLFLSHWGGVELKIKKSVLGWVTIFILAANIIDYAGNFISVWTNTLISRTVLGMLLGISITLFVKSGPKDY